MQQFLNSTGIYDGKGFLEVAQFTEGQRAMVVTSALETEAVINGAATSETTPVFLLSQTEVLRYMPEAGQRLAYTTTYAQNGFSGGNTSDPNTWYLRTPPGAFTTHNGVAVGVSGDGSIAAGHGYLARGFRPAMWIDYAP